MPFQPVYSSSKLIVYSSSKLIKNKDDRDSDDDSGEEIEEPFYKKSDVGEVTPKHASKL